MRTFKDSNKNNESSFITNNTYIQYRTRVSTYSNYYIHILSSFYFHLFQTSYFPFTHFSYLAKSFTSLAFALPVEWEIVIRNIHQMMTRNLRMRTISNIILRNHFVIFLNGTVEFHMLATFNPNLRETFKYFLILLLGLTNNSQATLSIHPHQNSFPAFTPPTMTWANTWKDILNGGNKRWKIDDILLKKQALKKICTYASATSGESGKDEQKLHILCPLAGDDPFVSHAWKEGHSVFAIDLVPEAVDTLRKNFGEPDDQWTVATLGSSVVWKHKGGRATLYAGNMLEKRPELENKCNAVYDKDSFGALDKNDRKPFCQRLTEFTREGAIVYVEVKNKDSGKEFGPPFHVEKKDLMEEDNFGSFFEHIADLGQVYNFDGPMQQMGHILQRNAMKHE